MMIFNLLCLLMNKFPVNMQIEYKQIIGIEDIGKFRILCDINVTKNEVNDFICTHDFVWFQMRMKATNASSFVEIQREF